MKAAIFNAEPMPDPSDEPTGRPRLICNSILNLAGQCLPLAAGVIVIPPLIRELGTDRFGVLTLAWVFIGYFSLFDLGLGRALTKLVAEKLGEGRERDVPDMVWTALIAMFLMGAGGTLIGILLLPWLIQEVLNIPQSLHSETLRAFYVLVCAVPVVITSIGLRGILEAYQRFDLTNAVRIPLGTYSFFAPWLVLPFSHSLFPITAVLVGGRILAWVVQLLLCFHIVPGLRNRIRFQRELMRPLLCFGSWMTITNIVGPLMLYLDRFLISTLVSVAAVAYYATPYEVVTKVLLIPGALTGVLFPVFSSGFAQNREHTALIFARWVKYGVLAVLPFIFVIIVFAYQGLDLWLGPEFAQNSARVLQYLAIGVLINSPAQIAFALIQGAGRPDLTAKLHLMELPFYLILLWGLIHVNGIEGAAIAWSVRIAIDMLLMFYVARRLYE